MKNALGPYSPKAFFDPVSLFRPLAFPQFKNDEFGNWDKWKERNRAGLDWDVMITRKGNAGTVSTENAGIIIKFTSEVKTDPPEIYMALTGDQVAITNIRIERPDPKGDNV